MIKIRKGLDLPITGHPDQVISEEKTTSKVAILGTDYVGMKPTMSVKVGDKVKKGQEIFSDKKVEGVIFTSKVSGEVVEINRGERRALQSVVVKVEGNEEIKFNSSF